VEWFIYLAYEIIKAFVFATAKAETRTAKLYIDKNIKGDIALNYLMRKWHVDYDTFGGESTPYFMEPRKGLINPKTGEGEIFLPAVMGRDDVNEWERIDPIVGDQFASASIQRGEITSKVLEPLDPKTVYIEWNTQFNDALRWEIQYDRKKVIIWKFRHHGATNKIIGEKGKLFLLFMSELTGLPKHMKRGYKVYTGFRVIDTPSFVRVQTDIKGATGPAVTKVGREGDLGDQMMSPNGVLNVPPKGTNTPDPTATPSSNPQPPAPNVPVTITSPPPSGAKT